MTRTSGGCALVGLLWIVGCGGGGGSSLDGAWRIGYAVGSFSGTETIALDAGGSVVITTAGANASCTGDWTTQGFTWSSTPTTVTFSGVASCTGALICGALSLACGSNATHGLQAGSCQYTLSSDNTTLVLSGCSWTTTTFTFTRAS